MFHVRRKRNLNFIAHILGVGFLVFLFSFVSSTRAGERPAFAHVVNLFENMTLQGVNYSIVGAATENTDYVEVSTDGGATWWSARNKGNNEWVYYWSYFGPGRYHIIVRARNNDGPEGRPQHVNVNVKMPNRLTFVQDVLIDDYGIKTFPEKDIEKFFQEISPHFNVIEVHFWNGFWKEETMKRAQKVIDTAHKYGMRVAISIWEYPNDNDRSPWWYHAYVLGQKSGKPRDIVNTVPFVKPTLDRTNPFAMRYMSLKYREQLQRLRDVDYIFFNEDMLQKWSVDWPSLYTPYYESPTWSWMALESWRSWLVAHRGEEYAFRKLPVADKKYVNEFTELNSDPAYLKDWQEWRQDVFANYLQTMAKQGYEAYKGNPNYHGAIYFQWQYIWDRDRHGVDLVNISQWSEQYVAMYVVEHGEGIDAHRNEDSARFVSNIARAYRKNFGGFVSFYRYFTGSHTPLETVKHEFELAVTYNAQMITSFNVETFYSGSQWYNPPTIKVWDDLVKKYIHFQ